VAGHQPNYLPWLGFFDKMRLSDLFIIEDSVLLENRGFEKRNKIKGSQGEIFLSVPVEHIGQQIPINEVKIAKKSNWKKQHWLSMKYSYCRAPFWQSHQTFFEHAYTLEWEKLVDLNMHLIEGMRNFLGIKTPLLKASNLKANGKKSELILAQCKELGAATYLSGIGAKDYLETQKFEEEGIDVVFQDFQYPSYPQLYGDFVPNLSAADYLFCTGGKPWWKLTNQILIDSRNRIHN
jgi:hypothetical protein